jgi:RNA polymerase sigma-70 factor (ECF subfamily)
MKAQPSVSAFVHSMVRDYHAAEDILQEVAVVLARKFAEYDETRPFVAWAIGIAKNKVRSAWGRQARSPLLFDPEVTEKVATACEEMAPELDSRTLALRHCLESIVGRSRRILGLRYEQGMKPRDIATRLGMNGNAVRAVLFRIRESLRRCIRERLSGQEAPS